MEENTYSRLQAQTKTLWWRKHSKKQLWKRILPKYPTPRRFRLGIVGSGIRKLWLPNRDGRAIDCGQSRLWLPVVRATDS